MKPWQTKLAAAFIALSLCVTWFYLVRPVPWESQNCLTVWSFVAVSHQGDFEHLPIVWKPRIGGLWLTGHLVDRIPYKSGVGFSNLFATYYTGWMALTMVALIAFLKQPSFVVVALFAGACYTIIPPDDVTMYPWDMSAMFFFTLSVLLWLRGNYGWMLPVILLGTLFKETVGVTALLFFFTPLPWKRCWQLFGSAFVSCLLLKLWVTHAVMGHAMLWTAFVHNNGMPTWMDNAIELVRPNPHWTHPALCNAGLLVIAFFLPVKSRIDAGIKAVLAVFCLGQFFGGGFREVREFLELLPLSAIYLQRRMEL